MNWTTKIMFQIIKEMATEERIRHRNKLWGVYSSYSSTDVNSPLN